MAVATPDNETPHKIAPAILGSIVVIGTLIAFFLILRI